MLLCNTLISRYTNDVFHMRESGFSRSKVDVEVEVTAVKIRVKFYRTVESRVAYDRQTRCGDVNLYC